ncbi:UBA/TS-N domain protein [Teladorsagia circumcincta]|uniref:UBA/TS-N domain protein n=1 Tax=Teladorsagia circumcincta TaxID=45464 RepID=A0A2G9T6J3_TELCI|nr:UBA/TS-N domain protein [Teladorsagia circumcincta]
MAIAFGGAMPSGSGRSGTSTTSRPASLVPTPPPAAAAPEPNADHILQLRYRFASQLVQLNEFGFTDEAANLTVLESCDGNVEVALDLLIAMREGI